MWNRKLGLLALGVLALSGCELRQRMYSNGRLKPLEPSPFFTDQMTARPLPEGVIARGQLKEDAALHLGRVGADMVDKFPFAITPGDLARGRERFDIFCSVCHGPAGNGDGMIVQRGFKRPPSLHIARLKEMPVGHFFFVMTNGFGVMPSYATQIDLEDRWRIVAYIRALQLSQSATLADVPENKRAELDQPKAPEDAGHQKGH